MIKPLVRVKDGFLSLTRSFFVVAQKLTATSPADETNSKLYLVQIAFNQQKIPCGILGR